MTVRLERRDEIALVMLDRPGKLNALSFATLAELDHVLAEVAAGDARAMIVTGAGDKAFCAGADIEELTGRAMPAERAGTLQGQAVMARLDALPMPSVALINGYAYGGGLELALACSFRLALPAARMGLPEIRLGLVPGYGGTQRLPRLIGPGPALEMILTGRAVTAEEALRLGLVNRILEGSNPLEQAIAFCRAFAGHSLVALRLARESVLRGLETTLAEGLKLEADLSTLSYQTADAKEGLRAFLEKRPPRFRDR